MSEGIEVGRVPDTECGKESEEKRDRIDKKEKDGDSSGTFICPVCGKPLHQDNLPTAEGLIDDDLYWGGEVVIINSHVQMKCDFEHCLDELGMTLGEPHPLIGIVEAAFDSAGNCIHFQIQEICAGKNKPYSNGGM